MLTERQLVDKRNINNAPSRNLSNITREGQKKEKLIATSVPCAAGFTTVR
jgi:hypothetical protein